MHTTQGGGGSERSRDGVDGHIRWRTGQREQGEKGKCEGREEGEIEDGRSGSSGTEPLPHSSASQILAFGLKIRMGSTSENIPTSLGGTIGDS